MRIRKATEEDSHLIAVFERLGIQHPWTEKMIRQDLVENPRSTYLVGEIPDCAGEMMMTGFIGACQILDEVEINNIVVAPAFRKMGTGRALLSALKEYGIERGAEHFYLEVRSRDAGVIEFYKKNGYVSTAVRKDYYTEPVDDAVLMKLEV